MADIEPAFETLENRLMRAWIHRNPADLKSLVSGEAIFMFGINPPVLLDRTSFAAAIERDLVCESFRFQELTARKHGKSVWFSAHTELEMRIGGKEWKGHFLITDLWRKSTIRRRWLLAERSLSPMENSEMLSGNIRALQLWR